MNYIYIFLAGCLILLLLSLAVLFGVLIIYLCAEIVLYAREIVLDIVDEIMSRNETDVAILKTPPCPKQKK